jgi:hypothetical protein
MDNKQLAVFLVLGLMAYSYLQSYPMTPTLPKEPAPPPPREDLDTGSPYKDGADYQPAALSGSGEPPRSMSYQFQ